MKKFFNYVKQCTININFYKDTVIKETLGGTFKYLIGLVLLLSFFFVIASTISLTIEFNQAYREFYNEVDPDFYIKLDKGELSSNVKQPYKYYDDNFAFILDTTGTIKEIPAFMEGVYFKKDSVIFKHEGDLNEIKYAEQDFVGDFNFDKEAAFNILAIIKRVALITLPIFMFIGAVLFGFIGKLIYLSIFALITWLISVIMKVKDLGYQKSFTLTIFAGTAPLIGRDILEIFDVPFLALIFYIAYFWYIVKVLKVIRK